MDFNFLWRLVAVWSAAMMAIVVMVIIWLAAR